MYLEMFVISEEEIICLNILEKLWQNCYGPAVLQDSVISFFFVENGLILARSIDREK